MKYFDWMVIQLMARSTFSFDFEGRVRVPERRSGQWPRSLRTGHDAHGPAPQRRSTRASKKTSPTHRRREEPTTLHPPLSSYTI